MNDRPQVPYLDWAPDEGAYYDRNPARRRAREWDYGVWWSWPEPHDHPPYRLTIVDAVPRPEVILVEQGAGTVYVLARMPPTDNPDRDAEAVLDGWPDACGRGALPWVLATLAAAPDDWLIAAEARDWITTGRSTM